MPRSTIPATKPRERCSTGPVDVDELAGRDERILSRAEYANAKNPPKDTTTMHRKLMSDGTGRAVVGARESERLDAERLLSQLGMDVTEEDYCLEGEFLRSNSSKDRRSSPKQQTMANIRGRCHSYDCNYHHPLEGAYEDFGVERKLVELKNRPAEGWRHSQKKRTGGVRSMGKMVRRSLGSIANNTASEQHDRGSNRKHRHGENAHTQPSNSAAWKARVVSVLRGNKQSNRNRVPRQIVAAIAPTSSEDVLAEDTPDDAPMTPDDLRLLYKWQTARTMRGGSGNEEGFEVPGVAGRRVTYPEEVLSITSSCGDKTTVMDNRRRRHRESRTQFHN